MLELLVCIAISIFTEFLSFCCFKCFRNIFQITIKLKTVVIVKLKMTLKLNQLLIHALGKCMLTK